MIQALYRNAKGPKATKASLKKKSKAGSIILPDSNIYYRASYEDGADARTRQQMGRSENPEADAAYRDKR